MAPYRPADLPEHRLHEREMDFRRPPRLRQRRGSLTIPLFHRLHRCEAPVPPLRRRRCRRRRR